ncbi:unnamed protein product [Rotaria sp. Silwood1]|nr:unnamed protein product [Rotaria sp. Silwood1]
MEYLDIGFNDLPDEILMIIFQKLDNLDVFYSLQGVNQRINKIIQDRVFTNRLIFVKWLSDSFIDLICCDMILDRFCLQILPEIHHNIKWLDLESSSMKHVLRTAHYPNLRSLGLYNIHEESLQCLFTDEALSSGMFKNQITTLLITIDNNKKDLPNLKCFSLSCNGESYNYNETILPLLDRMFNLEELSLYLAVNVNGTFIDGNHLKRNIIDYMPRLNQFSFYLRSVMHIRNQVNLPSTEDIKRTFIDFSDHEIISYVDYFREAEQGRCHIYSYPSFMPYYGGISNNFPGGLFKYVRAVSLYDEQPFDHEFFLRIVQSFPLMEKLALTNKKPQNWKQSYSSNNNNENLSVIEYSCLNELVIIDVHDDYIEEFLIDTKTYLPKNVFLSIKYESLKRVTHNFARDATRINCAKINELELFPETRYSTSLQEYFPYAKIY